MQMVLVRNRKLQHAISLPIGSVVLGETYHKRLTIMSEYIVKLLENVEWLEQAKGLPIVGLGGSIRTLAWLHQKIQQYPLDKLHGYEMDKDAVFQTLHDVQTGHIAKNLIADMESRRWETLYAGTVPLKCVMDKLDSQTLVISESGLREGAFFQQYLGEYQVVPDVLTHSLENLIGCYDLNAAHAHCVWKLCESLFDQLQPIHQLPDEIKRPLKAAALLHDIGQVVDYENHEMHGFYMVCNARLYGLSHHELVQAAFLVAMHRQRAVHSDWQQSLAGMLSKEQWDAVERAAVLLRIAEKLDRNEYGRIDSIECFVTDDQIELLLGAKQRATLQIHTLLKHEDLVEDVYGRKVTII